MMGQSTRKNPDKLIEQLKATIARKDTYIDLLHTARERRIAELKGEDWFDCDETDNFQIYKLADDTATEATLLQKVIILGSIVSFKHIFHLPDNA